MKAPHERRAPHTHEPDALDRCASLVLCDDSRSFTAMGEPGGEAFAGHWPLATGDRAAECHDGVLALDGTPGPANGQTGAPPRERPALAPSRSRLLPSAGVASTTPPMPHGLSISRRDRRICRDGS